MKRAPPMNTYNFFTLCVLQKFWQAVFLKPFQLEECILHFRKVPIFIYLVAAGQGHSCVSNTSKSLNDPRFISYNGEWVYSNVSECIMLYTSFSSLHLKSKLFINDHDLIFSVLAPKSIFVELRSQYVVPLFKTSVLIVI